jgi:hypothetical protein
MYEKWDKWPRFGTFYLPYGGHMDDENRWVGLVALWYVPGDIKIGGLILLD